MARPVSRDEALSEQFAAKAAELLAAEDDCSILKEKIRALKTELSVMAGVQVGSIIDIGYVSHRQGEVWQCEGVMDDTIPLGHHQDRVYLGVACKYRPITKSGKPSERDKHHNKTVTRWDVWASWEQIKKQSLAHRLTASAQEMLTEQERKV